MARSQSPDSANSQFFICFGDATFLDRQYTVWGRVSGGMEHVDKIKRGEPVREPDKIAKMQVGSGCEVIGRFAAAAGLMSIWTSPALATEWFICSDGEKRRSAYWWDRLGVGSATDFRVSVGDKVWSTKQAEGTPIVKSQAYENDSMLLADVAAEDLSKVRCRTSRVQERRSGCHCRRRNPAGGGRGGWAVTCPEQ